MSPVSIQYRQIIRSASAVILAMYLVSAKITLTEALIRTNLNSLQTLIRRRLRRRVFRILALLSFQETLLKY